MLTALRCCFARAEILSRLACAANDRRPLPDALREEGDPRLASLAADLQEGRPLGRCLARRGLIWPWAARSLDGNDAAWRLRRLADEAVGGSWRGWAIRWFPVALLASFLLPMLLAQMVMEVLVGDGFIVFYQTMGIAFSRAAEFFVVPWWEQQIWVVLGTLIFAGAGIALLRQIAWAHHLTHLWWPEVHRAWYLQRLLDIHGPCEGAGHPWNPIRFALTGMGIGIHRSHRPRWWADWRAWYTLTRFRMAKVDRRALLKVDDLDALLHAIGAVGRDGIEAARRRHHSDLRYVIAAAWPFTLTLLSTAGLLGLMFGLIGDYVALVSIIENIAGM